MVVFLHFKHPHTLIHLIVHKNNNKHRLHTHTHNHSHKQTHIPKGEHTNTDLLYLFLRIFTKFDLFSNEPKKNVWHR